MLGIPSIKTVSSDQNDVVVGPLQHQNPITNDVVSSLDRASIT